ncbi:MAG: hypothetical protein F4X99_05105 [Gammaproteobacteria bacterium]|nr:hypothetical protein [Gammaproteobacteria bacterium]
MSATRNKLAREAAQRGKYAPLYRHLAGMSTMEWPVSFGELEAILGFDLPASARLYRPWWSNQRRGTGHSHALAWYVAGWKTRSVDLESETLVFERVGNLVEEAHATYGSEFDLDEIWPAVPGGSWPPGFTVSRDKIYDDWGRLTGGPEDQTEQGS